jgi:hypothetical protein
VNPACFAADILLCFLPPSLFPFELTRSTDAPTEPEEVCVAQTSTSIEAGPFFLFSFLSAAMCTRENRKKGLPVVSVDVVAKSPIPPPPLPELNKRAPAHVTFVTADRGVIRCILVLRSKRCQAVKQRGGISLPPQKVIESKRKRKSTKRGGCLGDSRG